MSPAGTALRRGVVPLLAFAVLTAAMDVYAGNRFEVISPAALAAVSFTLVVAFFAAVEAGRRVARGPAPAGPGALTTHRRDLLAINITTALTWLSTFYALEHLEPAIVNVVGLALGPVVTALAGPLLRRHSRVLAAEVLVSVAICGLLGLLMWGSFSGRSGLGELSTGAAALGLAWTLACAAGSAVNIIYMKRLDDAGCAPGTVLATRFLLIGALSWGLVALADDARLGAALLPGAVVAVIGVGLPIYVLQVGVRHTEPITTSLLICLSPLFALALQLADGRLAFSPLTLGGVLGVVALVAVGVLVRDRSTPAPPPLAAPEPVAALTATPGPVPPPGAPVGRQPREEPREGAPS
ncbi:DMT family transporter [Streptomyces sp. DSM 44915]|uniref:DMT family transporter n=1 Tax=Streptomyces chisholmiae TaxID=3075540 RepID=A0ABU2JU53_9ACTN|nr:DMT family transporter [Streptomyces sp. DSM 44915]MDT0268502.1 DMT family transporter [Streptomyces sp. DSM 44915]